MANPGKRASLGLLLAIGLTSCSNGTDQHLLSGTKYCVPTSLAVYAPYWVPQDPPGSPDSFAFQGCADSGEPCPLAELVSGSAKPSTSPPGSRRLTDYGHGTHYRNIAEAKDTELKASFQDGVLILRNVKMDSQWFVWQQVEGSGSLPLEPNAQLLATCSSKLANPDYSESTLDVWCNRLVSENGIEVSYTFRHAPKSKIDFARIDSAVFAMLKSWECS